MSVENDKKGKLKKMQVQTITATTETTTAAGAQFRITVFEETVTGFCDVCGDRETGSREQLNANGWFLGSREHFCPRCND